MAGCSVMSSNRLANIGDAKESHRGYSEPLNLSTKLSEVVVAKESLWRNHAVINPVMFIKWL